MRLLLIRHAEAVHNLKSDHIAGPLGCTGLTPRGFEQAERLASTIRSRGSYQDCTILLSSPALRARQTAQALLPALPAASQILDEALYELLPGQADGMTREDYQNTYGKFNLQKEPDRPYAPGGESWNQFVQRAQETPWRIARQYPGQTILVVTHAGFIVLSFLSLFGVPPFSAHAFIDPDFTGITEWEFNDVGAPACRLIRYNDTSHLS